MIFFKNLPSFFRLLIFLLIVTSFSFDSYAEDSVTTLAQAELAFAKAASEKGIKESFLLYLSDDSVLFRPRAVPGKKWMADRPAIPGLLSWEPVYAEVSGTGDLGFTTGPWNFKESAEAQPSGYGQFFSIWQKQPDGAWKVILDAGIEHDKPSIKTLLAKRTGTGTMVSQVERNTVREGVSAIDVEFSKAFSPDFIAQDVFLLRNSQLPARGRESAVSSHSQSCTFSQEKVDVARSGDLAYTYGTYQCGSEAGIFVRVWRKEDKWRIAVDYRRSDS